VRLAYAGVELDPSKDSNPFKLNPKITMLQAMARMKGGNGHASLHSQPEVELGSIAAAVAAANMQLTERRGLTAAASLTALSAHVPAKEPAGLPASDSAAVPARGLVTAPGAGKGFSAAVQLAKQFRHIMRHPIPGISAAPDDEDEMVWHIKVDVAAAACNTEC
jgi:hypothetical protein